LEDVYIRLSYQRCDLGIHRAELTEVAELRWDGAIKLIRVEITGENNENKKRLRVKID